MASTAEVIPCVASISFGAFNAALCNLYRSRLCRDEVQTARGGQIKCIADHSRTRIERGIHFDLRQQFLSPSGTKNGHDALFVPNIKPVAGQQEASPDGPVRLVLPQVGA